MSILQNIQKALFGRIENIYEGANVHTPTAKNRLDFSQYFPFNLGNRDLSEYLAALNNAKMGYRNSLFGIYTDIAMDTHLITVMQHRKLAVIKNALKFTEKDGDSDLFEDVFDTAWFDIMLSDVFESIYYGYAAVQLKYNGDGEFTTALRLPYELIDYDSNVMNVGGTEYALTEKFKLDQGILFAEFRPASLGLLSYAAPYVIFKKRSLSSWDRFSQFFGIPLRLMKVSDADAKTLQAIQNFLETSANGGYGILPSFADYEIVQSSNTDAFNIFQERAKFCNFELSKLIVGGTMLTDDGSSRSQSEVHSEGFMRLIEADKKMLLSWLNDVFLPFAKKYKAYKDLPEGYYFYWNEAKTFAPEEKIKIDQVLLQAGIPLSDDYIEKTYSVEIDRSQKNSNTNGTDTQKKNFDKSCACGCGDGGEYTSVAKSLPSDIGFEIIESKFIEYIFEGLEIPFVEIARMSDIFAKLFIDQYSLKMPPKDYIKKNLFRFSAAKTLTEIEAIREALYEGGEKLPFTKFRERAKEIFGVYNESYLQTEYDMVGVVSDQTAIWENLVNSKVKKVRYVTVGDARVRPEHKLLNGTVVSMDSKFLSLYSPPNGWNCRCYLAAANDDEPLTNNKIAMRLGKNALDDKGLFGKNFATSETIFNEKHTYFAELDPKQIQIVNRYADDNS